MLNVQLKKRWTLLQSVVFVMFLLSSTLAFAQNRVTGKVTDRTGMPLPGVNVLEKGTTNGSITDVDGKYIINVAKGKTLQFSYIGFTTQEIKVTQNTINVTLQEDLQALDEVVVIGYGSMSRKDVTSSITTVKADKLNVGTYSDPGQLLQGKVPGLTITQSSDPNGGTSSITLRGASSLRGGEAMEPYYVVDGVPGVSLALIAPEDIESIDVLRDATATAIYGSKAANGVIIVTTKKGKAGKASVTYSAYVAADKVMKNLDMLSASELRAYAEQNNLTLDNDFGGNTDWQKEVQRTAFTHNHNVSISGGSESTTYNASINYMDRQGVIKGTDMDRLIGRAFVQTKALNDRLTLSMNLNASITNNHSVETGSSDYQNESVYDAMNYYSPLVPVRDAEGNWSIYEGVSQNYNPMSLINEDTYEHTTKKLQGTAKAELDIIDGLKWNAILSYQNEQFLWDEYHTNKSQLTKVKDNGQAHRRTTQDYRKVLETYLNYDKTFNDVHKLGVMLGYSWEETTKADGYGVTVYDFYSDETGYKNMGLANKIDGINGVWSSAENTLRMISFYGRANYSFNSKYLLQATVRRDGSSAFGENNRWATFPSFSAAWRISEEDFAENWGFDDLKLRAGYGVSGNSLGFDPYFSRMVFGATGWFTYSDGYEYHTIGALRNNNPDLKWETTSMFNVGVDFSVLGGRLGATIEYYSKQTSDLILDYEVSTNRYPFGTMYANVGDISNKGIEISINAIPVQTKNFEWSTTLNLSHNKNVVEKISNDTYSVDYINKANPYIGGFSGTNSIQRIVEGEPIGTFYTYHWEGYNEDGVSIFSDYDKEGNYVGTTTQPNETDRVKVEGSAQPKLNLGWNNTLNYKDWTLTAFFQGTFGNKIFNATRAQYNNVTNLGVGKNGLKEILERNMPNDVNAQAPSDRYIENGSYLRLSTLSLSYDFGKIGNWINNLKLTATCNNVFTITNYSGIDPEVSLGGVEPGVDWRQSFYPRTRTFMLGLNVNF